MGLTADKLPKYKGTISGNAQLEDSNLTDNDTVIKSELPFNLKEATAPATPAATYLAIYADTADSHLKIKDDAGNITDLSTAGGSSTWGGITGTLSDQTDLQTALDAKKADTDVEPINLGGTGQTSRQAAINALVDAAGSTIGHVLKIDGSNNAVMAAPASELFTDSTTTAYLTTTTDDLVIGATSPVSSAKFSVDGDADQRQAVIQGYSTQTDNILEVQKSDGTVMFGVSESGTTVGGATAQISDTNGNELIKFTATASAVNEVTLANAATGNDPSITASGSDSNIGIDLVCKGTGGVTLRQEPRITTISSSATPTVNTDNCDAVTITALTTAITSMTTNLSGTPKNFQKLIYRIKDDGTGRAITWGASFASRGVTLPTTTIASKVLTVGFIYNTVTSTWDCIASAQEA